MSSHNEPYEYSRTGKMPLDTWEGQASAASCMGMQAMIAETYLAGRETWKENRERCIREGGDLSVNPELYGPNEAQQDVEDWLVFIGMLPAPEPYADEFPVTETEEDAQTIVAGSVETSRSNTLCEDDDTLTIRPVRPSLFRRLSPLKKSMTRTKTWSSMGQSFPTVGKYVASRTSLLLKRTPSFLQKTRRAPQATSDSAKTHTRASSDPAPLWAPPRCRGPEGNPLPRPATSKSPPSTPKRRKAPRRMTVDDPRLCTSSSRFLQADDDSSPPRATPDPFSTPKKSRRTLQLESDDDEFRPRAPSPSLEFGPRRPPWDSPIRTMPVPSYFYDPPTPIVRPDPKPDFDEIPNDDEDRKWHRAIIIMPILYFALISAVVFLMICVLFRFAKHPVSLTLMWLAFMAFAIQTIIGSM